MTDTTHTQAMEEADHRLGFKPVADAGQRALYEANRALYKDLFAHVWTSMGPVGSREKSMALTALQESLMWLNAHVACNYSPEGAE